MADQQEVLNRWRLALGKYASGQIGFGKGETEIRYMEMDEVLDYLYSHEYGEEQDIRKSAGSADSESLTVPSWLSKIRTLFPKKTVEIMERHALERYEMKELLTDPEVLKKLEPNKELLKTILELKNMMQGEVLELAKAIVKKIADELTKRLEMEVRPAFFGKLNRNISSPVHSARNLDMKKTIRMNLKNYDAERDQLILKQIYFSGRQKRYNTWRVIVCVDESGSMTDSVIHSAIMAGIFAKLPMLDTKLVIFDTKVVDLSQQVDDPVGVLMSVQLSGGTNIGGALEYCESLIENPSRTLVVLVSDLFEGVSSQNMYRVSKDIIESGAKLIALTALDMNANPNYDRNAASKLASLGAFVGAMTPEELAEHIGEMIE